MDWYNIKKRNAPNGMVVWLWLVNGPYLGYRLNDEWYRYDPIINKTIKIPKLLITHWTFLDPPKKYKREYDAVVEQDIP